MADNTINDAGTMRPGGGAALGRIDKYELVRELGEGGFGAVYLAKDAVAKTDVAIKGLPPEVKHNNAELEGIRANFALVKRLRHPNIVAVTDLHLAQSVSYASKEVEAKLRVFPQDTMVVMDYAPGVTLAKWRKQFPDGKVPLDSAVSVVRQVASALDYAHVQKVLHRDVKPANIMVETGNDGSLTARVLDFGLAAEIRSSMGRVSREIRDTSGTRPYMAPEQWLGKKQGPTTDQYALAVIFYELVVGEVPFASVFDCGDPAVMRLAVTTDEPAIPANLPKSVRRALAVALAKKPEERFATCGDFVTALEGKAKVSRRGAEARRGGGRGALVAAVLLGTIACGAWWWMSGREGMKPTLPTGLAARAPSAGVDPVPDVPSDPSSDERRTPSSAVMDTPPNADGDGDAAVGGSVVPDPAKDRERLGELRNNIFWKKRAVEQRKGELDKYRQDDDGLSGRIANADELFGKIARVEASESVAETEKAYLKLRDDADALDRELAWLADNRAIRDETRKLAGELAALDGELVRFNAKDLAYPAYAQGTGDRRQGKTAFDKGDFKTAKSKYGSAKDALLKAIDNSRKALVDNTLSNANQEYADSHWEKCIAECDKVLGWDADNARAKELKAEAESHLVPTAVLNVLVDGVPLADGERVKIGNATWITPVVWGKGSIKEGGTYGGEVEYTRNGKRFIGTMENFTVNWRGPRPITIALAEYVGPKHGAQKTLTLPGGATMEMIYVEPGSFMMGSPISEEGRLDNEAQHQVTLTKGFWLGKYEVTQKQWQSVMGDNPSRFKSPDRPVENVSWEDCQKFIAKVDAEARRQLGGGARLPTEAEWEYACRAGADTSLPNGENLVVLGDRNGRGLNSIAWYGGNSCVDFELSNGYDCSDWKEKEFAGSKAGTHNVGKKAANNWGFHDMIGNVYEWCSDWYGENYYKSSPSADPQGPASGVYRVLRGGSWNDFARLCRSANRVRYQPGYRNRIFGFRLCCSEGPRK